MYYDYISTLFLFVEFVLLTYSSRKPSTIGVTAVGVVVNYHNSCRNFVAS